MADPLIANATFTRRGFVRGFRCCIPLALSVFTYGLLFGILAASRGMTSAEAALMSLTVFAGASQLIVMELWQHPLPIAAVILTTFIVNARYLLMGAAVQPWFRSLTPLQAYGSIFFCADENWALAMREFRGGERDSSFFIGAGFAVYVGWVSATLLGYVGGAGIHDPAVYGLDFALTTVLIALLVSFWSGKRDLVPWIVAAIVAVMTEQFLPGKWYIILGAIAGSSMEAIRYGR